MNCQGRKDDAEKPRWDLVPYKAMGKVVDVLTAGAKKYAPENWRLVPDARPRYFAAGMRHFTDWWLGKKLDDGPGGTGLPSLACVMCCVLFLLELELADEEKAR